MHDLIAQIVTYGFLGALGVLLVGGVIILAAPMALEVLVQQLIGPFFPILHWLRSKRKSD